MTDNGCPLAFRNQGSLASQLVAAKLTFTGFSEDLPSAGYTGCKADQYRRKHNPWVNFDNVASSSNQPFTAFPSTNLAALPTVSFLRTVQEMYGLPPIGNTVAAAPITGIWTPR